MTKTYKAYKIINNIINKLLWSEEKTPLRKLYIPRGVFIRKNGALHLKKRLFFIFVGEETF